MSNLEEQAAVAEENKQSASKKKPDAPMPVKKDKPAEEKTMKQENVMYIGPNSLTDGLKRFTVYRDEPTELMEQVEKKYKNIKRLFVPVGSLNQAMADVEKKGTPVYLAFHEVQQ